MSGCWDIGRVYGYEYVSVNANAAPTMGISS